MPAIFACLLAFLAAPLSDAGPGWQASTALDEGDVSTWAAVLQTSRRHHAPLSDGLLARSVRSPSSPVRAQAYWHLLLAPRWQPSPALRQALDTGPEAAAAADAPREDLGVGFAFELLQRMYRRSSREDRAWIESVQQGGPVGVPFAVLYDKDILERMLPSELRALSARVAGGPDALAARLKEKPPSPGPNAPRVSETEWLPVQRTVAMHTADPFPRRFVDEPKKIRNVPPVYPEAARQEHVQGTVVPEAIIASSGCVEAVEVQQSPDPRLSVAALVAVSRWRYTPTLLDGRPVPVIMHVTVNFRLS